MLLFKPIPVTCVSVVNKLVYRPIIKAVKKIKLNKPLKAQTEQKKNCYCYENYHIEIPFELLTQGTYDTIEANNSLYK